MKITKRQLKQIIKEEKQKLFEEFQGSMMDLDDHNRMAQQVDRVIIDFTKIGYTREDVIYALKGILGEV
tara:strand:- start:4187 stop:4393 length:207 start_codon:yes stop_codon:yes gene_type:complete